VGRSLRQAGAFQWRIPEPISAFSRANISARVTETVPYVSRFLGETQITDGHGNVLARLAYEDREGVVTADIAPGRVEGDLAPTPEGFWTAELPANTLQAWDHLNSLGRDYYATKFRPLLERDSHPA
jgi:predicted amidohydrolase